MPFSETHLSECPEPLARDIDFVSVYMCSGTDRKNEEEYVVTVLEFFLMNTSVCVGGCESKTGLTTAFSKDRVPQELWEAVSGLETSSVQHLSLLSY